MIESLHPDTRLPRKYDAVADEFADGNVIPAPAIEFLLRVHDLTDGTKYLDAAAEIGEAILEFAPRLGVTVRTPIVIPPDYIPNTYYSATGNPVAPESTYMLHSR